MSDINSCPFCLEKQQLIDKLIEENQQLKGKLRIQKRRADEGFFGSSTPSAKKPVKESSLAENQKKQGGAKPGHVGHGRKKILPGEADELRTIEAPVGDRCPHCHSTDFIDLAPIDRGVIESAPIKARKVLNRLNGKMCARCKRVYRGSVPSVMPKALYGNQLVSNIAIMNCVHGTPLGRLEEILGVPASAMVQIEHRLARILADIPARLAEQYRVAPVKHADETGWRTNGANGYAWLFATEDLSIPPTYSPRKGGARGGCVHPGPQAPAGSAGRRSLQRL